MQGAAQTAIHWVLGNVACTTYSANSSHWFRTSFLGGRCRKAMLGYYSAVSPITLLRGYNGKINTDTSEYKHYCISFGLTHWLSLLTCHYDCDTDTRASANRKNVTGGGGRRLTVRLNCPRNFTPPPESVESVGFIPSSESLSLPRTKILKTYAGRIPG